MARIRRSAQWHREAYCLMLYRSKDGSESEIFWNSRDGVTPFIVTSKTGKDLYHTNWHEDKFTPRHKLKRGDRYFDTMSRQRAKFLAETFVNARWEDKAFQKNYSGLTKEEVIWMLTKDYYGEGKNPTVLEFGQYAVTYLSPAYQESCKGSKSPQSL